MANTTIHNGLTTDSLEMCASNLSTSINVESPSATIDKAETPVPHQTVGQDMSSNPENHLQQMEKQQVDEESETSPKAPVQDSLDEIEPSTAETIQKPLKNQIVKEVYGTERTETDVTLLEPGTTDTMSEYSIHGNSGGRYIEIILQVSIPLK